MSDNCAVGPDGKLLDEKDIDWYNDRDDELPIAPAASSSTSAQNAFSVLLARGGKPATVTAGSRRSNRPSKPSAKVLEAKKLSRKRSTVDTDIDSGNEAPAKKSRQSTRSIIVDSDDEPDDVEDDEAKDNSDEDEDAEKAYGNTKALGDEDRVCCHLDYLMRAHFSFQAARKVSKDDRTADVKTIFTREVKVNEGSGKSEILGWRCNICRYVCNLL